jgi:predicted DNA-binding transcriptional regulator AlpA
MPTNPKIRSFIELPFYSLSEVERLTAIPAAKIKNMVMRGQFPRPIPIEGSGMWVWSGVDVEVWRQEVVRAGYGAPAADIEAAFSELDR